jgi:hypothetical protein
MPSFTGTYRHEARGDVQIEFNQRDGGQLWHIVVKSGMTRREVSTWQPDPWGAVRDLVGSVLDAAPGDDSEPTRFDMNKRLAKPSATPMPLRRRGKVQPSDLPEWKPPETA